MPRDECTSVSYPGKEVLSRGDKNAIERAFGRHINDGQVRYLKAGHLDVLESRRAGIRFVDPATGRVMVDAFTSAGCFNVGRNNPMVVAALEEALETLDLGTASFASEHRLALAEKLVEIAPGDLSRVIFAAGGGDAVDAAVKLARGATGRPEVVSTVKAYHGHTGFALSANGKPHYRRHFEPLMSGFRFVPFGDIEAMRGAVTDRTAAILLEPVQGEAGIFPASRAYLEEARALCDRHGTLLLFDEVQTGFGRTGKMFACEHAGVSPDVMMVAKALGGGLFPNAAVLHSDREPIHSFVEAHPDFHDSVVGGSDLGCFVSLRVIETIQQQDLCGNAQRMGDRLRDALHTIRQENPSIIREVRGIGLMVGLEYIHEFLGPMMCDALAKRGLFAVYSGNAPQVMRFMLPITIAADDLDHVIHAVRAAVQDMRRLLPAALLAAKLPFGLRLLDSERVQTALFGAFRKLEDLAGTKER
jgi:acetylornithine/succinyldiaminopimelate/putrescine aminotransferase